MTYQDMLEKMSPMNKSMLCSMLGVAEPPEAVCKHYFGMKKCLDKISAPISPVDLLRIAMDVGFNPETRKFEAEEDKQIAIIKELSAGLSESLEKPVTVIEIDELDEDVDLNAETAIEELKTAYFDGDGTEADEEPRKVDTVPANPDLLVEGSTVGVYIDGESKDGVIESGEMVEGVATYKVLIEGAVHELTEDDIE